MHSKIGNEFDRGVDTDPWIGRRGLSSTEDVKSLHARDPRAKCGTTQGAAARKAKRSISPRNILSKRALPEWPTDDTEDQDAFMVEQVEAALQQVTPNPADEVDINSALYSEIGGSDPVSMGLAGLTGCTALIVMSERAVYFGHFWETLSFESPEDFQDQVINLLNNGRNEDAEVQNSLAAHADDFNGVPGSSAFIIWPAPDDFDYTDMINQLSAEVNRITGITPRLVQYAPENFDDDDSGKALGRALYQYDPAAQDGDPKRGFRFIHEYANEGIHFF